jgi:hypothetical protein
MNIEVKKRKNKQFSEQEDDVMITFSYSTAYRKANKCGKRSAVAVY